MGREAAHRRASAYITDGDPALGLELLDERGDLGFRAAVHEDRVPARRQLVRRRVAQPRRGARHERRPRRCHHREGRQHVCNGRLTCNRLIWL